MINVIQPTYDEILKIQKKEDAFYWSICADILFKKHGFNTTSKINADNINAYNIFLRGNSKNNIQKGFYEGPLDKAVLSELGLGFENCFLDSVELYDFAKESISVVMYGRFYVKKIPISMQEKTEPYEYIDKDNRWNSHAIPLQFFNSLSDDWEILAYAKVDDELKPIIIKKNDLIIVGFPILDILVSMHIMPALDVGFYTSLSNFYSYPVEKWLIENCIKTKELPPKELISKNIWPGKNSAALSVRHDYDRPISDERLDEILEFYAERGIRSTWFLIIEKAPTKNQINSILALGHEVALHSVASTFDEFIKETIDFRTLTGVNPAGFTCHGGIGSSGHLALTHNTWAKKVGMLYGEMIGKCRGLPHPLIYIDNEIPTTTSLIVQNCHFSLDLNMKPEGHQLERLLNDIPLAIAEGGHITIMNHPDIHISELITLLSKLNLENVWCETIFTVSNKLKNSIYNEDIRIY